MPARMVAGLSCKECMQRPAARSVRSSHLFNHCCCEPNLRERQLLCKKPASFAPSVMSRHRTGVVRRTLWLTAGAGREHAERTSRLEVSMRNMKAGCRRPHRCGEKRTHVQHEVRLRCLVELSCAWPDVHADVRNGLHMATLHTSARYWPSNLTLFTQSAARLERTFRTVCTTSIGRAARASRGWQSAGATCLHCIAPVR